MIRGQASLIVVIEGIKYTGFLWSEACCVIFKSPLGVFPHRAFFIWPVWRGDRLWLYK